MVGRKLDYKLPKLLAERLRSWSWSVQKLAEFAQINEQTIYKNLSGKTPIKLRTALKVANSLTEPYSYQYFDLLHELDNLYTKEIHE